MGDTTLTNARAFELSVDHRNLYGNPLEDPVLVQGLSPHAPYEAGDFRILPGTRTKRPVRATFYADERAGTRFQGNLMSTSDVFETYAFVNAAIHPRLAARYPRGSYVRVHAGSAFVDVLIKDVKAKKSIVGIDLSKAAFHALFKGQPKRHHQVHLERIAPVACEPGRKQRRHPMAGCFRKDVYIEFKSSGEMRASEVVARRKSGFRRAFWNFARKLADLEMHVGTIARPFLRATYIPGKDRIVRLAATVGPFPDRLSARAYLAEVCWSHERELDAALDPFCRGARVFSEPWRPNAWTIYYTKPHNRTRDASAQRAKSSAKRVATLLGRNRAPGATN